MAACAVCGVVVKSGDVMCAACIECASMAVDEGFQVQPVRVCGICGKTYPGELGGDTCEACRKTLVKCNHCPLRYNSSWNRGLIPGLCERCSRLLHSLSQEYDGVPIKYLSGPKATNVDFSRYCRKTCHRNKIF
jgi:hypothetical protein